MKKILDLYFSPTDLFKQLDEKPDWLLPVVITLIIILIFSMLTLPKVLLPERSKRIMSMQNLTPEQKDKILSSLTGIRPFITTPLSIIIFTFIIILLKAGLFFLIFLIFGAKTLFKKTLAVVSYSFLVGIPETIIKSSLMLVKKTTRVFTSLALFFPNLGFKSPAFTFLSRIDIFTIWNLILISLGFAVIYRIKKGKSFSIVFGFWVLWLLVQLGIAFILPKNIYFS